MESLNRLRWGGVTRRNDLSTATTEGILRYHVHQCPECKQRWRCLDDQCREPLAAQHPTQCQPEAI